MTALADHIRDLIDKDGPISVARYMELALQHPEFGYYRRGDPLGAGGDFTTAPEISQMFGELIGLSLAEAWKVMGRPDSFVLLELGPGRGTLMQDMLRATAKIAGFHAAMHLYLLESNQTLRKAQEEKLGAHAPIYIDDLDGLPPLPVFIIANEFFDALPIRQFEKAADGWRERLVAVDGGELEFVLAPSDPSFLFLIPFEQREREIGAVYEVSLGGLALMRHIARHVTKQGGAALVIDYGFTEPPGKATLQAVSDHRHANVLERPGEVDLTAHIDFHMLAQMAREQGAVVSGPAGQGEYLQTLGIEMRAAQLKHAATPEQAKAIDAALHRLTDSSEMGCLFKAMAIAAPPLGTLAGF